MKANLCEDAAAVLTKERELAEVLFMMTARMNGGDDLEETLAAVLRQSSVSIGSRSAGIALREKSRWMIKYSYNLPQELKGKLFSDEEFPEAAACGLIVLQSP